MADHTKEPWLCDKRTVYALNEKSGRIFSEFVQGCHTSGSEIEANVRMIAAAPELLDAAIAVIERWDSPLWKDLPATAEYIGRLRQAVARAQRGLV